MASIPSPGPLPKEPFTGHFFGAYKADLRPYTGPDYGRMCFIFQGQGAVKPGMMRALYDDHALFRKRFGIADDLAKSFKRPAPSDYILAPERIPDDQAIATRILCLFTAECALYALLLAHYQRPSIITAHSFGEHAALVAAGIFSFEQMFEIVHHREASSPGEHKLGYLMVAYAGTEAVEQALDPISHNIANINAPSETVIAVASDQLKPVRQALKASGIKSNPLRSVPHPYHSPAMTGLRDAMAAFLKGSPPVCRPPRIPLYSGVTRKLLDAQSFKPEDAYDIVIQQSVNPIDFIQQIETLHAQGFLHYVEIGPRAVCATLVRDILPDTRVISRLASDDLQPRKKADSEPLDRKSRSFLGVINKVIGKVTGYQIERLSIEDRYQDELGIDSIKKAEIIVTVLDELSVDADDKLDTVSIETVGDMVDYLKQVGEAPADERRPSRKSAFERMVQSWVPSPLESIFVPSRDHGLPPLMIALDDVWQDPTRSLELIKSGHKVDQDLVLLANDRTFTSDPLTDEGFETSLKQHVYPLFHFIRGLLDAGIAPPILFLASRGQAHPFVHALNGLLKSVRKETASMGFKSLQVDDATSDEELQRLIRTERMTPDVDIRYVAGRREILKLIPEAAPTSPGPSTLMDGAVIAVFGGAKGITFSLIKSLAGRPGIKLHLAGRSAADSVTVSSHLAELRAIGADVTYAQLDATDGKALTTFLEGVKARCGRIDLLINGVGTLAIDRLQDKTEAAIDHEFLNKVLPARHALQAARHHGIRRVIQFSSVLARYGGVGQSIYSAANALIDSLTDAHNRASDEMKSSALSINWPPWDETGMTANRGVLTKLKEFGLALLPPDDASRFFEAELRGNEKDNVFYFDRTDEPVYAATPTVAKRAELLLGSLRTRANTFDMVFDKTFTLERDSYLLEHTVKGVPCVPAATAIAMFHAAARMLLDRAPLLENIHARNPILVRNEVETLLETAINDECLSFCLRSTIPHFVAEAKNADGVLMSDSAFTTTTFKGRGLQMAFYPGMGASADGVYHGRCFQMLERPVLDDAGILHAEIDDRSLADIFGDEAYSHLALWIDAIFQALGLLTFETHGLKVLPSKVGRLVVGSARPSSRLFVQARADVIEDGGVRGAASILTAEGDAVLSMTDITMAAIARPVERKVGTNPTLASAEA